MNKLKNIYNKNKNIIDHIIPYIKAAILTLALVIILHNLYGL